jgi:hypothetical protein
MMGHFCCNIIYCLYAGLQHFVVILIDTNLPVEWIGLRPEIGFIKSKGLKYKF